MRYLRLAGFKFGSHCRPSATKGAARRGQGPERLRGNHDRSREKFIVVPRWLAYIRPRYVFARLRLRPVQREVRYYVLILQISQPWSHNLAHAAALALVFWRTGIREA